MTDVTLGQATQAGTFATGVQYHPHGGIKQFTYGNGIVHTMALNARMLPVSSIDSGGVLHQLHEYDANGNVVATHDLNDTTRSRTMDYDGLDRLVEAQSAIFGGSGVHRFEYDAVDNLMHWTLGGVKDYARYVYGADNRLARIEGTGGGTLHTFSHDVQGNVTDKDSTDYHFDIGNRLRLVVAPSLSESYRYDGHGRRVLAWTSAGSKLSMYSATGQILYQQLFPATQNKAIDYITLSGSLVANREVPLGGGTAVVKYQHTDALGSPVAVTDSAGAVVERTNYDPYGGVIGGPKDGVGYTGHVMDAGAGLHYMQQRYYDSAIGRFLSVDPMASDVQNGWNFNRYNYAANNPYKFTDPDGREVFDCRGKGGSCAEEIKVADLKRGDIVRTDGATIRVGQRTGNLIVTFNPGFENGSSAAATGPRLVPKGPAGADVDANRSEARGRGPLWFRDQVKNKGPWDYKQQGKEFEEFGNFNYGATGRAHGFRPEILLQEAGRAQTKAGTSDSRWGSPGIRGFWETGTGSYGDDPRDQFWIQQGIRYHDEN